MFYETKEDQYAADDAARYEAAQAVEAEMAEFARQEMEAEEDYINGRG
jgi:hypothetical protein